MERLLVTGMDSLLGANLAVALAGQCEVLGLYEHWVVESPLVRTAAWNPADRHSIKQHFDDWQPQWILHCGPLANGSWDREPSATVAEQETLVVARLAEAASESACRLTVLSSDVVFAGPRMFHDEATTPASPSPRAARVRAMERVLEHTPALVVRTHAYGWGMRGEPSGFAEQMASRLCERSSLALDGRRHATPILVTDLADLLCRAFEMRLHGLYHLSGAERTSPYRFVTELAGALGLDMPPCLTCETTQEASTWHDETSLSSKRARRMLGAVTPMLREGLDRFADQQKNGWCENWHVVGPASSQREMAA